jgi:hypothetical protein
MKVPKRHESQQDKFAASARRSGKMAVVTRCGVCDRSVVGVIMRDNPGQYCIECKGCGFSATSHFSDGPLPADGLNKI